MPLSATPVIAAIPNYNMAASLAELLPQLLKQNYAHIYVLDDASTDNSRQIVEGFGARVTYVSGKQNVGSGANRNRILEVLQDEAIIHFLDADTSLLTQHVPDLARGLFDSRNIGFIGGLVTETDGSQNIWNYGPRQCLHSDISATIHASKKLRTKRIFKRILSDWPDLRVQPVARSVYFVLEANLLIRASTFRLLGGFDPNIGEHDIHDLATKAYYAGLISRFDPCLRSYIKTLTSGDRTDAGSVIKLSGI